MHTRTHIHNITLHTCLGLGGVVTAIDCSPDQVFSLEEIERVYYANLYYYQEHDYSVNYIAFSGIADSQACVGVRLPW